MVNNLSPREIQARIRSGASIAEVVADSGMPESRVAVFAGPVLAEREYIARVALKSIVHRRGDHSSQQRLGDLIASRLLARGLDTELVSWDAWREPDQQWRVVGRLEDGAQGRQAEFLYDATSRYSVADNADARWMIGEEVPGTGPDNELTVDFDDELALVRATSDKPEPESPGDDVPDSTFVDSPNTSELDELYDMLSGISEDSVRIYTGLDDPDHLVGQSDDTPEASADGTSAASEEAEAALSEASPSTVPETANPKTAAKSEGTDPEGTQPESAGSKVADAGAAAEQKTQPQASRKKSPFARPEHQPEPDAEDEEVTQPQQASLIADVEEEPQPAPKKQRRSKRAKVPSWEEIMFGR